MVEDLAKHWHCSPVGAHLHAKRLIAQMKSIFALPRAINLKRLIAGCEVCLRRKAIKTKYGTMQSEPPSKPWKTVAMDFAGPYTESSGGHRYILVFVDHFTKHVELVPLKDQRASSVLNAFYSNILCRFGTPVELLSDNGPQFRSELIQALCTTFKIKKTFSSPYYPQGDGFVERFMRTLNNSLSTLTGESPRHWHLFLPGIQFAYNSTVHAATGISPF